jgi:hypothetical protein
MNKKRDWRTLVFSYVPRWALILFALAGAAFIIELISKYSVALADFTAGTIGKFIRVTFAYTTYIFPFSVAELLLWASPFLLAYVIYLAVKCANASWQKFSRFVAGFLALASTVYTLFVFAAGTSYYGTKVAEKMGIERRNVSAQELYDTAVLLTEVINEQLDSVVYPEGTYSAMPYTYQEMNRKLNAAYAVVCEKYDGIDKLNSRTKPVILSPYWTYTHISGLYTFFTGEANVNTNYPQFIVASTAAHEMAHQRGVSTEDEANFVAFVACMSSDDPFIKYAGCADVLQDVMNSLYTASPELYTKFYNEVMPTQIKGEYKAYAEFFDKYRDNVAADVAGSVNNSYIENHNQPAGVRSYGMVVDLVVSYMLYTD